MRIPAITLVDILDRFKSDWDSKVCPNCGAAKWKNSPFCRSCSIRLQRKNLIGGFRTWTGHGLKAMFRFFWKEHREEAAYDWLVWYDRCRDYLHATGKQGPGGTV